MGVAGLEPDDATIGKNKHLVDSGKSGGAESGAESAETAPSDPELAKVIDAWPTLPEAVKAGIVAMVEVSKQA